MKNWATQIGQMFFDGEGGGSGGGDLGGGGGGGLTPGGTEGAPAGQVGGGSRYSIIEQAVKSSGGQVDSGEDAPAIEDGEATSLEGKPDTSADPEEAELVKLEQELKAKNTKLQGKMDVARHQAVLTRQRNQAEAAAKEAQAKWEAEAKELSWAKDPETKAAIEALKLADSDPDKFLGLLMNDPRYKAKIRLAEAKAEAAADAADEPRPEPDATYKDETGQQYRYYSSEGLEKRMAWERKQASKEAAQEAVKQARQVLDQEYGPVKQEFEARNQWNRAVANSKQTLAKAETWHGFTENKQAIAAFMEKNENASLEEAYREVVVPKLHNERTVNEAELRKKIIAEMNKKPAAAASEKPGMHAEIAGEEEGVGGKSNASTIKAALRKQGLI